MRKTPVTLLALCSSIFSCGEDSEKSTPDAAIVIDAATSACTYSGFSPDSEKAERDLDLDVLFYTGLSGQEPNVQQMSMDLYFPFGANDGPHSVVFDGENLMDCHSCFLVRRGCNASNCLSGQVFLAQEGSADFTRLGAIGEQMQGSLENAVFAEVTIGMGLKTTLVPGGETWCIDDYRFDVQVGTP